jgi:DNA-binding PadR family transcriptional regulator
MTIRIRGLSPLTPPEYYILAALAMKDTHAYILCQKVTRDSGGAVTSSRGAMSKLLRRLTEEDYIAPLAGSNRPQLYKLTDYGHKRLERETRQHQRAMIVGQTALAQAARYYEASATVSVYDS